MSRRTSATSNSSFDLFLDTICNTFGGVVFLAILLAIMIQSRSVIKSIDLEEEQPPSAEEVRELITQLDDLSSEYASLQALLATLPEANDSPEDGEYLELANAVSSLESELEQTVKTHSKYSKELAELLRQNAEMAADNASVPKELSNSESQLAKSKAELRALVTEKQQSIRLPKVRQSNASAIILMLRHRELYIVKKPSLYGNGFNTKQVTVTSIGTNGFEIEAIRGSGSSLESNAGLMEFKTIVSDARQRGFVLKFAVWPECYGDFDTLKGIMIAENVFYELWPQATLEALELTSGSGPANVQ